MNFFRLLNTKEDILKNVGNQTVDGVNNDMMNYSFIFEAEWAAKTKIKLK